jgi:hypothetical protein
MRTNEATTHENETSTTWLVIVLFDAFGSASILIISVVVAGIYQ